MKPTLVLYATREGQTRKIAEHFGDALRVREVVTEVRDAAELPDGFKLDRFRAVVVAASVHGGRHEAEMTSFVKTRRGELESMPTAFLSVSLSEAGAEDQSSTEQKRAEASAQVQQLLQRFFNETGWHPARTKPVAGALLYRKYGRILRFVMKQIVKRQGGPIDTSRDYEFTDWVSLDQFVDDFIESLPPAE